jgi:hypothetical protein
LDVEDLIAQIPEWARDKDLKIEPMAGLTNRNYTVTAGGEAFVLRISGENTGPLGINRALEWSSFSPPCGRCCRMGCRGRAR